MSNYQVSLLDNDDVKVEILRQINDGYSRTSIARDIGVNEKTIRRFLNKETYQHWWSQNEKPIADGTVYDHHTDIKRATAKSFILTSAQNNTYVLKNGLKSMEVMADRFDADIYVGTFSYNMNGFQNLEKNEGWFDPLIQDYITDEPIELADGLIWCGELNILPTAVNPLSGFHSYTKDASGVIPHVKVQMESLPRHKTCDPRALYTTGAITKQNYIQKKAGQKAAFHHVFGALFVEVDEDGDWFARQIICDRNGNFYDLDTLYTPEGYTTGHSVEAVNWGDIHAEKPDPYVYYASWGDTQDSILDTLKPKYQFIHDVLDMKARNHHNINDPYFRFKVFMQNEDSVEDDIKTVGNVLQNMQRDWSQLVVVESNHDLALKRWLKSSDYKTDPANALFFLECQYETYKNIADNNSDFNVFEYAVKTRFGDLDDVRFLKGDEGFMICGPNGIQCDSHGDIGANGSRGSIGIYQKMGSRYNIGHSHSPGIKDGVCQSGVSGSLEMGYNFGGTSWSHTHIVTYKNSKRALLTLKNGKWRSNINATK